MSQGQRHDALRILDFAHAAGYVNEIADKVRDGGGHLPGLGGWMVSCTGSRHEGPARVLRHLSRLARRYPQIQEQVNYLRDPARPDGLSHLPYRGVADWVCKCGKQS
jgi:hypothetical protein